MEMEKSCEFCLLLRPIVYCKADAAHLCLSCDAKVHSANTLSNRHPRTIVCEMCRNRPAFVQCFQHQMFICRGCDCAQHDLSSQHQRKVICSFVGCPSAKDFAALWGFDLNEFDGLTLQDQSTSNSNATVDKGVDIFDLPRQSCSGEGLSSISEEISTVFTSPKVGSSRRKHPKGIVNTAKREDMDHILQQILDLKRLQLNQGTGTYYMTDQEEIDVSSFRFSTIWKPLDNLDQHFQHSLDLGSNLESLGNAPEKSVAEYFPSLFSHLDGDDFWQCKSPAQNGQSWPQNMQDLGVCDDQACFDDLSMPEVDLTFKNIEELFGNEQELDRALLDGRNTKCSSVEKDFSLHKSDNGDDRAMENLPAASSSVFVSLSAEHNKDIDSLDNTNNLHNTGECPARSICPSYPRLSFSRKSAESSEPSSSFTEQQHNSYSSSDMDSSQVYSKENVISRYKEKKKIRRREKQTQYATRKAKATISKH